MVRTDINKEGQLDCLLIFPPFDFPDGFYSNLRAYDPPLGLLALAAYVRQYQYSVQILDCNVEFGDTDDEFEAFFQKEFAEKYDNINVIGFTTTTPTINAAFRVAAICRKYFPKAQIVFGGAHASFVPDEALDKPYVDAVAISEGEETLKELLDGVPYPEIDGLAYKNGFNGKVEFQRNKPRERIRDLDELPIPAYDLIEMDQYTPILGAYKRLPAMMMVSSRGCPWSCNFCRRPVGKLLAARSAENIYKEMKMLSEVYGIKDIAFQDDVFTVNHENVNRLCDLLIQNPIDVNWLCFARVDIVSPDLLQKMNRAGCWQIMFGVENFNQDVLNGMGKGLEVQQIFDGVNRAKEAGLEVRVCMIIGNPGDTEEIINNNIDLVKQLDPDYLSNAILTPFPGHAIYNWAIKENRIMSYDWDLYYGATPLVKIDNLSPEDIKRLYRKMTFEVYFRPRLILKKLLSIRSLTEFKIYLKGFLALSHFMLEKLIFKLKPTYKVDRTTADETKVKKLTPGEEQHRINLTKTATKQTAKT
jgi:radical SAM superfamily enzyme YgiQ (UPF0313 family)